MKSGWFWGTPEWHQYLLAYSENHSGCLEEYKSSPLAADEDLEEALYSPGWVMETHQSQVIDLRLWSWGDIRKSYHSLINGAKEKYLLGSPGFAEFVVLHKKAFGDVRSLETFAIQSKWVDEDYAMVVMAGDPRTHVSVAGALWITYKDAAYYASGPSMVKGVQHAVVWKSLAALKSSGYRFVDMGQIDGATEKEQNIGKFKQGFGGEAKPFVIARRVPG